MWIPSVGVTAKRLLDLIPLGAGYRDASIGYTRICRTIDSRQKFHPAATPSIQLREKRGTEKETNF